MGQISFAVSTGDREIIGRIAERQHELETRFLDNPKSRMPASRRCDIAMDLAATHANGWALRLSDLLAADDFNFAHDVFGIACHLNRETGELGNHFHPRFSQHIAA